MTRILFCLSFLFCLCFIGLYPGWYDSAELAAGSFTLGLTHPPGQPFYILLNYAFSNLFMVGTIAFRSAVLSCLLGLAGVYCAYTLIVGTLKLSKTQKSLIYISLLTIPSLATQITRIELYTLILLLALLNLLCIDQHIRKKSFHYLYMSAFICGLALCVHTLMAFFQTLLLMLYCSHTLIKNYNQNAKEQLTKTFWLTLLFLTGFACNAYLIIRARAQPELMMMPIKDFSDFIYFISAKTYARSFSFTSIQYNFKQFFSFLKITAPYIVFALPSLIVLNFSTIFTKKTILLLTFITLNAVPWLIVPYTFENPDTHGYVLIFCFSLIIFAWHILLHSQETFTQWRSAFTSVLAALLIGFHSFYFIPALNSHGSTSGKIFSSFLKATPYNSISILTSDHWVFNYWYAQYVENIKPDNWILPAELAKNKWYLDKYNKNFKAKYNTKIFEENQSIDKNSLFLSSSYFDKEKTEFLEYCKTKLNNDFSSIEKTICTYTIVQWSKQFFRQNDLASAIQILEKYYTLTSNEVTCPVPEKQFKSPFLLDTREPLFLPLPNHGTETLVYYYLLCNQINKKNIDQILNMNPSLNTYLLLTQAIMTNSSSEKALKFLKAFKANFSQNPEQYQHAVNWLKSN